MTSLTFGACLGKARQHAALTEEEVLKRKRAKRVENEPLTIEELAWRLCRGEDEIVDNWIRNIRRWENDGVIPNPGIAQRIADALGDRSNMLVTIASEANALRRRRSFRSRSTVDPAPLADSGNRVPVSDGAVVSDADRECLETIVRDGAIAGGIAGMGYFKSALRKLRRFGEGGNPSTEADVHATIAVVRALLPQLEAFANSRDKRCCIYGEELGSKEPDVRQWLDRELADAKAELARDDEEFADKLRRRIGVLFDAIDGTGNFDNGLPLFCTAVTIFDGVTPFASAIYMPTEHVVIYGSAAAYGPERTVLGRVFEWNIGRGDQRVLETTPPSRGLVVAAHLSRTDLAARSRMLAALEGLGTEKDCRETYLLNSGQLALGWLASGEKGLSAFINPSTSVWDVSAAHLVEAQGGVVTTFDGKPIEYTCPDRTSVIAAVDKSVHNRLLASLAPTVRSAASGGNR